MDSERIYNYILENPGCTTPQIEKALTIPQKTISAAVLSMMKRSKFKLSRTNKLPYKYYAGGDAIITPKKMEIGKKRKLTMHQMLYALNVGAPCTCEAPIIYSATCYVDDQNGEQARAVEGMQVYILNLNVGEIKMVFNGFPEDMIDQDNLDLKCSRCGASWVGYNPLFDF